MERAATSSDEEGSSGEEELAQLMPLRIIDARIIGTEMGPEEKFRLCATFACARRYRVSSLTWKPRALCADTPSK